MSKPSDEQNIRFRLELITTVDECKVKLTLERVA